MHRHILFPCFIAALVAAVAIAAPILPRQPRLPDEVLCVAKIERVSIVIPPLPAELLRAGVTAELLDRTMRQSLSAARIEVVDDQQVTPRLVLHAMALTDPSVPDGVGLIFFLDVQQEVDIIRLDRRMTVPTTTVLGAAQTTRANLQRVATERCTLAVQQFLDIVQRATVELE